MKETPLTLFGEKTPRVVIYKSESHKLHQAFTVAEDNKIVKGMPVAITAEGQIEPFTGDEDQVYLGIAVTDNVNPAYGAQRNFPVEVTVMMEGYAICNWVSKEALDCGYVQPDGTLLNDRFSVAATSAEETRFISITKADEANELIQVIIR